MKRLMLLVLFIGILGGFGIGLYEGSSILFSENSKHYDYFKEKLLVGVDGKINLSGIQAENKELYDEVVNLFEQDNFDYDYYINLINEKRNSIDSVQKEIDGLSIEISSLEDKKNSLNEEYKVLVNKYNKLKQSTTSSVSTSNSYNFPLINQYPKYQTGCESVALTMLLRYYGVSVTPDDVISKLKKGSVPYWENGVLYGGNPEVEFVGNPYSSASYGVYEKPMADVANYFKSGVKARSGIPFNEVINLVKSGKPVMIWTSMGLAVPYISSSWTYKPTGEIISWKANEHAVVMIDATDTTVIIADPIGGKIKSYSRSLFENRYNYFGRKVLYY